MLIDKCAQGGCTRRESFPLIGGLVAMLAGCGDNTPATLTTSSAANSNEPEAPPPMPPDTTLADAQRLLDRKEYQQAISLLESAKNKSADTYALLADAWYGTLVQEFRGERRDEILSEMGTKLSESMLWAVELDEKYRKKLGDFYIMFDREYPPEMSNRTLPEALRMLLYGMREGNDAYVAQVFDAEKARRKERERLEEKVSRGGTMEGFWSHNFYSSDLQEAGHDFMGEFYRVTDQGKKLDGPTRERLQRQWLEKMQERIANVGQLGWRELIKFNWQPKQEMIYLPPQEIRWFGVTMECLPLLSLFTGGGRREYVQVFGHISILGEEDPITGEMINRNKFARKTPDGWRFEEGPVVH